jgi:hypothetical protein
MVTLRDPATGEVIARNERDGTDLRPGVAWVVALPAESVRRTTTLSAEIEVHGAVGMELAAAGDRPATVVVDSSNDGLKLVYAAETVIYQRLDALPRARWASGAVVLDTAKARLDALSGRDLAPEDVVLSEPEPAGHAAEGKPAHVTWLADDLAEMTLSVDADGSGYLVLADAIQHGWRVTVDDQPAQLLDADHAFVAVAVPAGTHTVRFYYPSPLLGAGMWMTTATILALIIAGLVPWWRRRRAPSDSAPNA